MSDDQKEGIQRSPDSVVGQHSQAEPFQLLVGPSTSSEFNVARLRLIPVACWRVDDIRFAFDSSFITADASEGGTDIRKDLLILADLLKQHPGCPLSVFGHADPVGQDDYNKALAGRRATAVYSLLINNKDHAKAVTLWQQIAHAENWGEKQRAEMRALTNLSSDAADRELIGEYLKALSPDEIQLDPTVDFLARGADANGKGDYQGCGEFNPVLLFSQEEQADFDDAAKKGDKARLAKRNLRNQPNRRAMVLIFRKGSQVIPAKWPCPSANAGVAGCVKRFWSDGEKRRSTHLSGADRKFEETRDTFACRFYQRVSDNSPCEQLQAAQVLCHFSYILHSDLDETPLANLDFQIQTGSDSTMTGKTDGQGILQAGDVPPGDYPLKIGDIAITVPALNKREFRRPLRVRPDASNP
jgi:hypothetical protein